MSTTTTEIAAKKAPAKRAPAKAAPKKAPEVINHETGKTADEAKVYVATATGRGGKTNTRKVPVKAVFAVDVADPDGRTPAAKAGLIYRFFASEAKAKAFADRMNGAGNDAIVVASTSKEA